MQRHVQFLLLLPALALVQPARAAVVSGTVLAPDGKPVAGAKILLSTLSDFYAREGDAAPTATSDAAGKWKIEVPDPKPAPGKKPLPPLRMLLVHAPGFAITQAIASDKPNEIRLQQGTRAVGIVLDGAGKPAAKVPVRLSSVVKPSRGNFDVYHYDPLRSLGLQKPLFEDFTVLTGADGRWAIADLPTEGEASFEIRDARYAQARAKATLSDAESQASQMTARATATFSGRVVDEDGKAVANASVSASMGRGGGSWAGAKTAADGTYRLESLSAGAHMVQARDRDGSSNEGGEVRWVAEPLAEAMAVEGQEKKLPDIVATRGAIVTGVVTDEASGAPLAEASVYNHNTRADSYDTSQTDAKGIYRLRVLSGKAKVYIAGKPPGYLSPEQGGPSGMLSLSLAPNEVKTLNWKLRRGLDVSGIALSEDKQVVPGATLRLRSKARDDNDWGGGFQSPTGSKGEWNIQGLKPGQYTIVGDDNWEVVSPREIALPQKGELQVLVRRLASQALDVRAVTPDGKPISKVALQFSVLVPNGPGSWLGSEQKGETDEAGKYSLAKLRPDYEVKLQATRAGYKYLSGGKAKYENNLWAASDIVMMPLLGRAQGRVVDVAGQPVQGAKIFSPDAAGSQATSDAEGRFTLPDLPEGEITLVATSAVGAAARAARAGEAGLSLTLRSQHRLAQPDRDTAFAILEDVWETSRGSKWLRRATLPAEYAADDLDQALKLALNAGEDKNSGASLGVSSIIERLLETDTSRAMEWAPAQLALIQEPLARLMATVKAGLAASNSKPALAAELYGAARNIKIEEPRSEMYGLASLAALAARLGNGEADALADRALLAAKNLGGSSQLVSALAMGGAILAEKGLASMEAKPAPAGQTFTAATPDINSRELTSAYAYAIKALAPVDPQAALALLDRLEKVNSNQAEYAFGQAALSVIEALGPRDATASLALARRIEQHQKPEALALAARFQPKEAALALLREASQAMSPHSWNGASVLSRIAAQAYDLDQAVGSELFAVARDKLQARMEEDASWRQQSGAHEVAAFAFNYSRVNPIGSRVLLEQEWAFQKSLPPDARRWSHLDDLAVAMAALDAARAREMAWQAGSGDDLSAQFEAQVRIARLLLNPQTDESKLFSLQ